jgi:tRNA pseudouridine55 synthase
MNGILLIDKEQDWTSNDVVAKLKGILHQRRIGHSGTLDPLATGLLVVFVGRATRAVEFAEGHDKRYIAGLRLGQSTDTQDITGTVIRSCEANISREQLENALEQFKGEIQQIPPMYSAIKHNGQRLYDIARKGGHVERKARAVTIHDISIIGQQDGDWLLDISCSKGTYVRTICDDLGQALGCGGCMSSLRRIQAGRFDVADAVKIGKVQEMADMGRAEELLLPVDSLFDYCPSYVASVGQEKKIRCGNEVKANLADGEYRVYAEDGQFLMLGKAEGGILKTAKSFFEV